MERIENLTLLRSQDDGTPRIYAFSKDNSIMFPTTDSVADYLERRKEEKGSYATYQTQVASMLLEGLLLENKM